jgi:hypothetical protein
MKIGEAWQTYSGQLEDLWEQKRTLLKQQKDLTGIAEKKSEYDMVTVQLTEVNEQYDVVHDFTEKLFQIKTGLHNAAVAKQQGETLSKATEDASKCIEIARRIASGGKVPAEDVKKLMEYNPQMYMQALNARAMNKHKSNKEYESLWEEEDSGTKSQNMDVDAEIDGMELPIDVPEETSQE